MADGGAVDIKELAQRFSREDLRELLRAAGKKTSGWHCQCPYEGCRDHAAGHRTTANIHRNRAGTAWVLSCHSCQKLGDYVEVYQAVKGVSLAQALEQLGAHVAAPPKPHLRVVRAPVLQTSADKLTADQVRKVWAELGTEDGAGESYLEGRRLREAVALGYVRFALETSENGDVRAKSNKHYRVGALLSSLAAQPLGVQFRTVDEGEQDKMRSLTRGHTKGVYFGRPGDVNGARCVVVAEGMADSLAALLWVRSEPDTAVVGVPGAGNVAALADALDDAGVDVSGQLWVLLAQHDRGKRGNTSLGAFMQLKSKLLTKGADVVLEADPPGDAKDWAAAWQLEQLGEWPPTQVRRFLGGDSAAGETSMSRATGAAIWHSEEALEPEHLGKDLTSLTYLLSADVTRVPICGAGEWRLNEMTDEVEYAGQALQRGDYTRIRLNLESFRSGMNNKRLQFPEVDIRAVAQAVAERKRYSPVREYLERLTPDGGDHVAGLGRAMGLDERAQGLELEFLRRWLVAAVARTFEPGCQVDSMLVLQGEEGEHKSRLFEELGGQWYVTMSAEMGSINAVETMRRGWIIELDEMDAVARTREFSSVKAFITRATDVYVPKYIREAVTVRRASVLGGTVNHEEFLSDEEGLRRFWVIGVRSRIDRQWIREHRDQLWAQAVVLYRAKQQWHLEAELEVLRRTANQQFIVEDPWRATLAQHVEEHAFEEFFRPEVLLGNVLKIEAKDHDDKLRKRVARIMKGLGFRSELRSEGRHARFRGWARPKEKS